MGTTRRVDPPPVVHGRRPGVLLVNPECLGQSLDSATAQILKEQDAGYLDPHTAIRQLLTVQDLRRSLTGKDDPVFRQLLNRAKAQLENTVFVVRQITGEDHVREVRFRVYVDHDPGRVQPRRRKG